jgi:hypothetical protein
MFPRFFDFDGRQGAARILFLAIALVFTLQPLGAQELSFSTENDLFTNSSTPDDLYTFSLAAAVELGEYRVALRENAFTDRVAGLRFDETYLGVSRALPSRAGWRWRAEAGLARVGRGLFGQGTQNAVHRLIGSDEVELRYLATSLHPRVALQGERWYWVGGGLELAPIFEAEAVPGLRYHATAGARARCQPASRFYLDLLIGMRWDHVALDALAPHIEPSGAVAKLEAVVAGRVVVSWSVNEYGDEREHVGLAYRIRVDRDEASR